MTEQIIRLIMLIQVLITPITAKNEADN